MRKNSPSLPASRLWFICCCHFESEAGSLLWTTHKENTFYCVSPRHSSEDPERGAGSLAAPSLGIPLMSTGVGLYLSSTSFGESCQPRFVELGCINWAKNPDFVRNSSDFLKHWNVSTPKTAAFAADGATCPRCSSQGWWGERRQEAGSIVLHYYPRIPENREFVRVGTVNSLNAEPMRQTLFSKTGSEKWFESSTN